MSHYESAKRIVANVVNTPLSSIPDDASIQTLPSWDSIAHINIILAVEEFLGHQMTPEDIISATSLKSIAYIMQNGGNADQE